MRRSKPSKSLDLSIFRPKAILDAGDETGSASSMVAAGIGGVLASERALFVSLRDRGFAPSGSEAEGGTGAWGG
jgi:hypothetical protein